MLREEQILEHLRAIMDPELGVDIVELGFVKEVSIQEDTINIKMRLTVPGCPLADYLLSSVQLNVESIAEGRKVNVELLEEPWTPPWEGSNGQDISRAFS
jgi:serine O-acetyltransferase